MKSTMVVGLMLTMVSACARFQPATPAVSPSDYGPSGIAQSVTMKDSSIQYDPSVLRVGNSRDQVVQRLGDPNSSRTTDSGQIEDVYAFNPDGSKFVDPKVRPRNVAMAFFSMGASVAVRQARLALAEKNLTLYHVLYGSDQKIQSVTPEKLEAPKDSK